MTGQEFLRLEDAAGCPSWARLCGPEDLFNAPAWLAVEGERVGPWVPRDSGHLVVGDGDLVAGVTVQRFDRDVDDETVRLDKMFPPDTPIVRAHTPEALAAALQPSLLAGTWFNSRILTAPGVPAEQTRRARRDLVDSVLARGHDWGCAAVFFPFVAAADTELRQVLGDAGFLEFPAPARHVFTCRHADYDTYVASLPARKRRRLRREAETVERAGLRTAVLPLDGTTVECVARLAHCLEQKYGQSSTLEQLRNWFDAIGRHTRAVVFTAAMGDDPANAMSLWIHHRDRLYGFHAGFDYAHGQDLPLYSLVAYHLPMRYGFAHPGVCVLEYGVSSDEAKLIRGTTALPQVLCVKALSVDARRILTATSPPS